MTRLDLLSALRKALHFETFTARQLSVMLLVAGSKGADDPVDFGSIARELNISKPATSRACDTLFARGFIERVNPEYDRRRCDVTLTDAGRKFIGEMMAA